MMAPRFAGRRLRVGVLAASFVALFTLPAFAQQAGPAISEDAKRHFTAGVSLLQDPEGEKVEDAYREFKTAYDLSGSPKILGNMGFCAMRLERDGEAIDAYSRYLREVPDIDADERTQIVRDVQTLSVGVTRVTLSVNAPGVSILDERIPVRGARVTNSYGPVTNKIEIGIRPGHHVITARLAGRQDASWEFDASAGSREEHAFTLKEEAQAGPISGPAPVEQKSSGTSVGPWIVIGAGGALLAGGAITGLVALNKTGDISDRCPNDRCPAGFDLDSERSSAKGFVRATDVLLGLGLLTLAGGLVYGYLTWSAKPEKAKPEPTTSFLRDWRLAL